jgi:hypothetical protein
MQHLVISSRYLVMTRTPAEQSPRRQGAGETRECCEHFTIDNCRSTREIVVQSLQHRRLYHRGGNFEQTSPGGTFGVEAASLLPPNYSQ